MHIGKLVENLYIVSTPIGNLEDITLRALRILKNADIVACEDTRRTKKLLLHYGLLNKKLVSYHEFNERTESKKLIEQMESGKSVAVVCDAGTPCISDPGYRIVKLARQRGIKVIPIPGASAAVAALSASGFPSDKFMFYGFLPRKEGQLRRSLTEISSLPYTVIAYESPHRILKTLEEIKDLMPKRKIGLYREITKLNEEFIDGTAEEILLNAKSFKGEIVLLFPPSDNMAEVDLNNLIEKLRKEGKDFKETVKLARNITGKPKREIYQRALEIFKR